MTFRPRPFAERPINGHALAHLGDEFGGDDLELVVAYGFHGGFVGGERIVKGDLVVGQAEVFAALGGGVEFLGEADEFLDHLHRADGAVSPKGA